MRAIAVAAGVLCVVSVLVAREASAQCLVEYEAEISPPIGAIPGESQVKTKGTFDCGVLAGELCGSGVSDGSCLQSNVSSWVVSCDGTCTADFGNVPGAVVCDGLIAWEGRVSGQCASGACSLEGESADGTSTTFALALSDPADVPDSLSACGPGGSGVGRARFTGLTTIPLPAP